MPTVGQVAWAVEWCSDMPMTEYGDADMDGATYSHRLFRTREAALAFSKDLENLAPVVAEVNVFPIFPARLLCPGRKSRKT